MTDISSKFRYVAGLGDIAFEYDALIADIWGIVHNGIEPFETACEALRRYRMEHGPVVLVSNAPRPSTSVAEQLDGLGVDSEIYDAIVTSGDVTSFVLEQRQYTNVFHLGPERDLPLLETLKVHLCDIDEAQAVLCTGLVDDTTEVPEDYGDMFSEFEDNDLTMICANPDLVVERGDSLVYCAGALAQAYEGLGGEVVYAGKPYAEIYQLALTTIEEHAGREIEKPNILAIGDGLRTDIRGALNADIPCLFVAGGIHGNELIKADGAIDREELTGVIEGDLGAGHFPQFVLTGNRLVW
jgi:HAD superfamily hydrolase (TIGR01459 family)